jgi:predicted ester cyclase
MAAHENKETVRRLMEDVLGQGRLTLLAKLVAAEYVGHFPLGDHYGPGGFQIEVASYRAAFPDLTVTLDDLLADGDKVVRRFTLRGTHRRPLLGVEASGRPVLLRGIAIDRLAGGRLVESWVQVESLRAVTSADQGLE